MPLHDFLMNRANYLPGIYQLQCPGYKMNISQNTIHTFNLYAGGLMEEQLKLLQEKNYKFGSKLDRLKIINEYLDSFKNALEIKLYKLLEDSRSLQGGDYADLEKDLVDACKRNVVEYISLLHRIE